MTPSGSLISIRSVCTWGFLNLALLGIGAAGFPLWAHHPYPREALSIYVLICGQTLLASMLFPLLAETRGTLAINVAIVLPFDELAGLLSNLDQILIFRCGLLAGTWLAGLGAWRFWLKSERTRMAAVCAATCFAAGGAVLDYLRWEAASISSQGQSVMPRSLLPALCDAVLHFNPISWIEASFPLVLAMTWFAVHRLMKSHSTSFHNAP